MTEPERFVASLSTQEREELLVLASDDRTAFAERLKDAGFAKMGIRLKVEALLLREDQAEPHAASAPTQSTSPDATPPAPPAASPTDSSATAAASSSSASAAEAQPDSCDFVAAAAFAGARSGFVFKMGRHGVGYYADAGGGKVLPPEEARLRKGFQGNLSWLSEEPDEPGAKDADALPPAPATAPAASTALALPGSAAARRPPPPPGRLSNARRKELELFAGPFAPPLLEGKYSEKNEWVRVNGKRWAFVEDIKMNNFHVVFETGARRPDIRRPGTTQPPRPTTSRPGTSRRPGTAATRRAATCQRARVRIRAPLCQRCAYPRALCVSARRCASAVRIRAPLCQRCAYPRAAVPALCARVCRCASEQKRVRAEARAGAVAVAGLAGYPSDVNGAPAVACVWCRAGERTVVTFHELHATGMNMNAFVRARKKWQARAPLAKKTLADDRRGCAHASSAPRPPLPPVPRQRSPPVLRPCTPPVLCPRPPPAPAACEHTL